MVRAMAIEMVVRATCMRRAYSCLVWLVQTGSVAVPVDKFCDEIQTNFGGRKSDHRRCQFSNEGIMDTMAAWPVLPVVGSNLWG